MKLALIVFAVLGVACANPLKYDLGELNDAEQSGHFIEPKPEIFPNIEGEVDAPRPQPPNLPRPKQVHHNQLNAQGPFAGRLVNVVYNQQGTQGTAQRNNIVYNINGVRRTFSDDFAESNE